MKEIQLVGGCFDGKICEISDETFRRGYLEVYEPLPEDFDHMGGCFDLKVVEYRISFPDTRKWRVV